MADEATAAAAAEITASPEPLTPQQMLGELMGLFEPAQELRARRTEIQAELGEVDALIAGVVKTLAAKRFAMEPTKRPEMNKWLPGPGGHAMRRTNLLVAKEVIGLEIGALWERRLQIVREFEESGISVIFYPIDEEKEGVIYNPRSHEPFNAASGRITVSTPFRFDVVDVEGEDGSLARVHLFDEVTQQPQVLATAETL